VNASESRAAAPPVGDGAPASVNPGRTGGGAADRSDNEPWTVLRMIRFSAGYLDEKGVESSRLDAEHLLAHALETTRLQLYLEYDRPLTPDELDRYRPLLRRRAAREPLQYVLGQVGFRDLELATDPRALIPRPETEVLVEAVLEWAREEGRADLVAADVGTGSGCIALALATEGPMREVWAGDIAAPALALASENVERVDPPVPVHLHQGRGLTFVPGDVKLDVVVSNPPYVRDDEGASLAPEIRDHEPADALFAGADGLAVIRTLIREVGARLRPGGLLALEIGAEQGEAVTGLLEDSRVFIDVGLRADLAGRPRVITAVRRTDDIAQ